MNHRRTLARPYAKAVFEIAAEQQTLTQWSNLLALLSTIASDPQMVAIYGDPRLDQQALCDIFFSLSKNNLDALGKNFIALLASQRRLYILPEITNLYETYKAALEKTLHVTVVSAFPIEDRMQDKLIKALEIRLQRAVLLKCVVDKQVSGGAIIRAGDLVIDGSVRSKLDKLRHALIA